MKSKCLHGSEQIRSARSYALGRSAGASFCVGLLLSSTLLVNAGPALPRQRVVAWGDTNYDLTVSGHITQVSAGNFHSLALKTDGSALVWGDNRYNQTAAPEQVTSGHAVAVAAGNVHNLALLYDGTVVAWGPNPGARGDYGQCIVPGHLTDVTAIAAGAMHSLALRHDGAVVAWGLDRHGQSTIPSGLKDVVAVAGGMYHSLALRHDGTVVAWGDNSQGQCDLPPALTGGVVAIAAGGFHSMALKQDGSVVEWGAYGRIKCNTPAYVRDVVAIATGDYHSLALKQDGTVIAWGLNGDKQLAVPAGLKATAIAARGSHSIALVTDPFADLISAPPAPAIAVEGGSVRISWPASDATFALQQTTTLDKEDWTTVAETPVRVGSRYEVTVPSARQMFFKLTRSE